MEHQYIGLSSAKKKTTKNQKRKFITAQFKINLRVSFKLRHN